MKEKNQRNESGKGLSASFVVGAIALVFLILGYQTALFVQRAAVSKIVSDKDRPDTVYVYMSPEGGAPPRESSSSSAGKHRPKTAWRRDSVVRRESPHSPEARKVRTAFSKRTYENFPFNPNTVSVEDLQRLGFSEKQALSIDRYRSKGGRFRRKSDFAKSYVVEDSVYQRLEPYITIPLIDINSADSALFETLPGIGPYFAAKMVSYRSSLGGYSYKEQLMDIYRFDEEKFNGLKDLISVGRHDPYPLWRLSEDSLKLHPYIRSYAAHGILLYRNNNPKSKWTVEGLCKAGVIKKEYAEKLSRCDIEAP